MKKIEITTSQQVTIEYELAALRERILGVLLDWVLVWVAYYLFIMVFGQAVLGILPLHISLLVIPLGLFLVYCMAFELLGGGRSLGKRALGTKVMRLDGRDPEWGDALLRAAMHLVDSIFSFGLFGSVLVQTTERAQRFGDMAAGTVVVRLSSGSRRFQLDEILKIQSLGEGYTVQFPEVRRLSEVDMVFIKNLLTRIGTHPNGAHFSAVEDLVSHLMPLLGIARRPDNRVEFLKTLLRDYIVLTR